MNHALRTACITLVLLAASCRSSPSSIGANPQATVTHVVLCWLKTPGNEAAREAIIETSRTFATIPGVVSVTAGRALPSTRPVVDSSFDVAIVIGFIDEAALRAYDSHPTHQRAVQDVLKRLSEKSLIYDFVDEGKGMPAR